MFYCISDYMHRKGSTPFDNSLHTLQDLQLLTPDDPVHFIQNLHLFTPTPPYFPTQTHTHTDEPLRIIACIHPIAFHPCSQSYPVLAATLNAGWSVNTACCDCLSPRFSLPAQCTLPSSSVSEEEALSKGSLAWG